VEGQHALFADADFVGFGAPDGGPGVDPAKEVGRGGRRCSGLGGSPEDRALACWCIEGEGDTIAKPIIFAAEPVSERDLFARLEQMMRLEVQGGRFGVARQGCSARGCSRGDSTARRGKRQLSRRIQ
jgi:hypothetical protein